MLFYNLYFNLFANLLPVKLQVACFIRCIPNLLLHYSLQAFYLMEVRLLEQPGHRKDACGSKAPNASVMFSGERISMIISSQVFIQKIYE